MHTGTSLINSMTQAAGGGLFVQLWELFITLDDEVEWVWSKPNRAWIKWTFLYIRYFTLLAQFLNRCIDMAVIYHYPLSGKLMTIWYLSEVIIAQLAMAGVEIIMMARVYALYRRHAIIKLFFISLLVAEISAVIIGIVLNIPNSDFQVDHIIDSTPGSFAYFGIAATVSQITIIGLLAARYRRRSTSEGPFLKMLMLDGAVASLCLLVISLFLVLYTFLHIEFATTCYAWLLVLASSAGCRLILNLQTLPKQNYLSATASLQLTTIYMEKSLLRTPTRDCMSQSNLDL